MSKDTITTMTGLVLVGAVVVATFLYGNHQRQSQLRHDQNTPQTSQGTPAAPQTAKTAPNQQQPAVQKPSTPQTLQGSQSTTSQNKPSAASVPPITGSATETPKTGPGSAVSIAFATIMAMTYFAYRRSRFSLRTATVQSALN